MVWNPEEIKMAFQKVSKRSATDKSFRELCLKDPAAAIREAMGKELPSDYKVKFIENQGADATFVLPDFKENPAELNDKELDSVAGGMKCGASCGGSAVCVGGTGICAASCGASCVGTCLCVSIPTVTGA